MQYAFLKYAVDLAYQNVQSCRGGPFGAVVVKDGCVVGIGVNNVVAHHDPTAHAEVQAIRDAGRRLCTFNLEGAEMYSSSEPCPMCLSALYWSNINVVHYVYPMEIAKSCDFDDTYIYEQLCLPAAQRDVKMIRYDDQYFSNPFELWIQHPTYHVHY
ncbi:nucleoside deaminase [Longirhabdus pacifica]|uniref:nucleoside deaminase n=1 Tax=Longirhabdus pacifica TaxID=2305227 RepID=UPI0013E8DA49|nr:nucleoside deaminase [Longirhabdus pacifica]